MTDWNLELQRFIDNDLTGKDRVRLLARLGRDETLREQLIGIEQLAVDARRLARPVVPDDFVNRVMDGIGPTAPDSPGRWLADLFGAPRVLHWNLAGATAVVSVATLVMVAAIGGALSWQAARLQHASAVSMTAPDLAAPTPVLVRLVVLHPDAATVAVAGDFNGWNPDRTPLEQVSDGAWAVTVSLAPGRYEYLFVVDGREWMVDPFAVERTDDGFGSQNAVLDVRPPGGAS